MENSSNLQDQISFKFETNYLLYGNRLVYTNIYEPNHQKLKKFNLVVHTSKCSWSNGWKFKLFKKCILDLTQLSSRFCRKFKYIAYGYVALPIRIHGK